MGHLLILNHELVDYCLAFPEERGRKCESIDELLEFLDYLCVKSDSLDKIFERFKEIFALRVPTRVTERFC